MAINHNFSGKRFSLMVVYPSSTNPIKGGNVYPYRTSSELNLINHNDPDKLWISDRYFVIINDLRRKGVNYLTSLWTKWPPFRRRYFLMLYINEKFCILVKISHQFVPKGPNDNHPAQVQIMAWRLIGDTPLLGPMLTWFTYAYMRHYVGVN